LPTGSHRVSSSRSETIDWLQALLETSDDLRLYVDIETQGDIKKLHHSQRRLLCVGLHNPLQGTLIIPDVQLKQRWPELIKVLGRFQLVAHNGKFDLPTLGFGLGGDENSLRQSFDTLLAHYVLQPGSGEHGLEPLAVRYLAAEPWDVGGDKTNMELIPKAELYHYNALDVQYGWELLELFEPLIRADEKANWLFENVIMAASRFFQKREPHGIGFDPHYTRNELAEILDVEAERRRKRLIEMAHRVLPRTREVMRTRSKTTKDPETGEKTRTTWKEPVEVEYEFNPGSWQQILKLYEAAGVNLPGTAEEVMLPRAERGDEFAAELLAYRRVTKELSTYVVALLDKANDVMGDERPRLFTTFKIHGTLTGRLSSENPNVQNIPRKKALRKPFVPYRSGRVLVQVDMSQAELRVIAALSGDPYLLELFHNPDVDIFTQMLPGIFPRIDFARADEATVKEARAKLKGTIYGLNFGRGARAISVAIGAPLEEGQRIIDTFFDNAERVQPWRQGIIRSVHDGTPIVSRFGRHFQNEVITPKNKGNVERSALSFQPQSNSSDINLMAAMAAQQEIEARNEDWHIVALVHDAITIDCPEQDVEDAAFLLGDMLKRTARKFFPEVPFATDAKWGTDWSQTS
jgi:DNA polymerase I-like protein with 3'-5' exonuclease and polymerase domains